MGFDLVGKSAKKESGESFRNNVWWWRPLWQYVSDMCPTIITKSDMVKGEYNDGHTISEEKATRIAIRLEHLIKQGEVAKFTKDRKFMLDSLPDVKCDYCKGKKKEENGKPCVGCKGTGKMRPWATAYPFNEENVKEFAKFCRESGGFEIW